MSVGLNFRIKEQAFSCLYWSRLHISSAPCGYLCNNLQWSNGICCWPLCSLIMTVGMVDMTRLCPPGIAVMAETKSWPMCQDVHWKPRPFIPFLAAQPLSQGSDWRRLYRDNLPPKSTSFSLIPGESWAVPNKLERWFLPKVFAFCASLPLCFVSLCTEPSVRSVRLWKLLLRFVETLFCYFLFHHTVVLWFQDSMNMKQTQLMFRKKLDMTWKWNRRFCYRRGPKPNCAKSQLKFGPKMVKLHP